jgi:hypothetical protein
MLQTTQNNYKIIWTDPIDVVTVINPTTLALVLVVRKHNSSPSLKKLHKFHHLSLLEISCSKGTLVTQYISLSLL